MGVPTTSERNDKLAESLLNRKPERQEEDKMQALLKRQAAMLEDAKKQEMEALIKRLDALRADKNNPF